MSAYARTIPPAARALMVEVAARYDNEGSRNTVARFGTGPVKTTLTWAPVKPKPPRQPKHRGKVRAKYPHLNLSNHERIAKLTARRVCVLAYVEANPQCTAKETQAHCNNSDHAGAISTYLTDLRSLVADGKIRMSRGVPRHPAQYTAIPQ